jgi:hypothetical protein
MTLNTQKPLPITKAAPQHTYGGAGERMYSSYSLTTSALDGVSGQRHAPAALNPRAKGPPAPIVQEAGWAPEPVWTQPLPGIEPRSPGRPARSQTLYCLSYPVSILITSYVEHKGKPNVVVVWLEIILHIREVPGSHLGPETGYYNVFVVFLSPARRMPEKYFKITPRRLPFTSISIHHSLIPPSFDAI